MSTRNSTGNVYNSNIDNISKRSEGVSRRQVYGLNVMYKLKYVHNRGLKLKLIGGPHSSSAGCNLMKKASVGHRWAKKCSKVKFDHNLKF